MKNKNFWLRGGILVMMLVFGMAVIGCNDGSNDNGGGRDNRLVLEAFYAWVDDNPQGNRDGLIFKADGTVLFISDNDHIAHGIEDGIWGIDFPGTWSTSGNNLTISLFTTGWQTFTVRYTVTSNTFTWYDPTGVIDDFISTKKPVTIP
jgi:hypothetical protein